VWGRGKSKSKSITVDVINAVRYYFSMIQTFHCQNTQDFFNGKRVARFANIAAVAMRKLQQLHAATELGFLRIPPGNRLETLQGDRAGQYSIRINDQWRVCFVWEGSHACLVEIVDYH
jgi:toxin HigB-1